jgi:transposase
MPPPKKARVPASHSAGVLGDRGYDAESIRQGLRDRGIIPFLANRNTEHGSGLGRWRWMVERTFAWLNQFQ